MCTKKSLRRKIEEKDATIKILENEVRLLRGYYREAKERLSKFDHKNRKRDKDGQFIKG